MQLEPLGMNELSEDQEPLDGENKEFSKQIENKDIFLDGNVPIKN